MKRPRRIAEEVADLVEVIGRDAAEETTVTRALDGNEAVVRLTDDRLRHHEKRVDRIGVVVVAAEEVGTIRDSASGWRKGAIAPTGDREVLHRGLVRMSRVERGDALLREESQRREDARLATRRVVEGRSDDAHERVEQILQSIVGHDAEHDVRRWRSVVWRRDRRDRRDEIGPQVRDDAGIEPSL